MDDAGSGGRTKVVVEEGKDAKGKSRGGESCSCSGSRISNCFKDRVPREGFSTLFSAVF